MNTVTSKLFTSIGRISSHLPKFRGKDGTFLRLFDALGLKSHHILIDAILQAPIKYRVRLDLHSWLQRLAFVSGEYEASTVEFIIKLHESFDEPGYVLDIGANIGLIGIPTALMIKGRRKSKSPVPYVVCIEAVPDNEKALRKNIELNDAGKLISVIGTGLGDIPGKVDIQVEGDLTTGEGTGTANILPAGSILDPNGTYECVKISIQITTLDALTHPTISSNTCQVIKIDTDGYDLKVLQGGRDFLDKNRPVIYGEFAEHCLKWHGQSISDVLVFAESINYLVWQRLPGKTFNFTRAIDFKTYSQDLILIPVEYQNILAWCCR